MGSNRITLAVLLAMITIGSIGYYFILVQGYKASEVERYIYWGMCAVVFLWFTKLGKDFKNVIGSFGASVFWPVSLITFFFCWLSVKLIPVGKYKWLDQSYGKIKKIEKNA